MSKKKVIPPDPQSQALTLCGVDSHAHMDSSSFDTDREEVLARAKNCGIAHIGNVFVGLQNYLARKHYFENHTEVFFILGIHPCDAHTASEEHLAGIEEAFLEEPRLKALGEIGLDYYWDSCPKDVQMQVFIQQLHIAKKLEKPVVIHCRDAFEHTVAILEKEGFKDYPLLWHCFGGNKAEAKHLVHNGWHISIPGPVSYPKNDFLREAVQHIPLDRLMLETDCPYLSPNEWRGKRNEPALTVFTAKTIAAARNMDTEELWQVCGSNAQRFFDLSGC